MLELLRTDSIVSLNVYDLETTQAYLAVTGDEALLVHQQVLF
jgi:hypothetical protein